MPSVVTVGSNVTSLRSTVATANSFGRFYTPWGILTHVESDAFPPPGGDGLSVGLD